MDLWFEVWGSVLILVRSDNSTHRRDIEAKQHTAHRGNTRKEVDIIYLGEALEHGRQPWLCGDVIRFQVGLGHLHNAGALDI